MTVKVSEKESAPNRFSGRLVLVNSPRMPAENYSARPLGAYFPREEQTFHLACSSGHLEDFLMKPRLSANFPFR